MLKKILLSIATLFTIIAILIYWFITSLQSESPTKRINDILPKELPYIANALPKTRGKILAVVTSTGIHEKQGTSKSGKKTGYELTELSRAYYVFTSNGFEVDIASPKGGLPPVTIDKDDLGEFDYAFLNDVHAQEKVSNSLVIEDVREDDYQAVYFIGGKGAMFDFPNNKAIKNLITKMYENGKTVAAICHGPAALINVRLSDGNYLLDNKRVSSFTNDEEIFLISDAKIVFPFLLEDKLREQGAYPEIGSTYLEQVSHDGNLITGQNPWSIWKTAESIILNLGYKPVPREITPSELTVNVIMNYYQNGYALAHHELVELLKNPNIKLDKNLLLMHSIVAMLKWDISSSVDLLRLLSTTRR